LSHFYIDDKIEANSDDFEQFVANKNLNIHNLSADKIEKLKNLMEFESRTIFTVKPQPVVTLMGTELSKIVCGNDHVLVLTQDHKLYSWGSNE
jgi:alpha-tubulin suppressor-like RCC1 family protein